MSFSARLMLSKIARGRPLATSLHPICLIPMVNSVAHVATVRGGVNEPVRSQLDIRSTNYFDFERVGENIFRTTNLTSCNQIFARAAYGGLIMSQALAAAEATIPTEFKPHSMHSLFMRKVDPTLPVDYHVQLLRDGRSLCSRRVVAVQKGQEMYSLQSSFHVVDPDSRQYQSEYPKEVKPAEECSEPLTCLDMIDGVIPLCEVDGFAWTQDILAEHKQVDKGQQPFEEPILTADERFHRWMTVFATDSLPGPVILRPHNRREKRLSMFTTLDHVMHFHHHEIRADEWNLYQFDSTSADGGRGFTRGRIWRPDGKLLVSMTQEYLLRT